MRSLIACGVPIFRARPAHDERDLWLSAGGSGGTGYWLPREWQPSEPNPDVLSLWEPGDALCAVMGHRYDAVDVDPRNGGEATQTALIEAGHWPRVFGVAETPSGGRHELIAPLGVGSRDAVLPGIDLKGGRQECRISGISFRLAHRQALEGDGPSPALPIDEQPDPSRGQEADHSGSYLAALIASRDGDAGSYSPYALTALEANGIIPPGERRRTLLSEAGRLRAAGVAEELAIAETRRLWRSCAQPLGDPFPWSDALNVVVDVYQRYPSRSPGLISISSLNGERGASRAGTNQSTSADHYFDRSGGLRAATLAPRIVEHRGGPLASRARRHAVGLRQRGLRR